MNGTADRMQAAIGRRIAAPRARLDTLGSQLDALSPLRVLGRGYSIARLADGRLARVAADLPRGTRFSLRVSDGDVAARAE